MVIKKQTSTLLKKPAPESFLLNIYHPGIHEKETNLVGTVEKLGDENKHVFHDIQELLHLLGIDSPRSGEQKNDPTL